MPPSTIRAWLTLIACCFSAGTSVLAQPAELPTIELIEADRHIDIDSRADNEWDDARVDNTQGRVFVTEESVDAQGELGSFSLTQGQQRTTISTYSLRGTGEVLSEALLGSSSGAEVNSEASTVFNVRFRATKSGPITAYAELFAVTTNEAGVGAFANIDFIAYPAEGRGWRFSHSESISTINADGPLIFNVLEQVEAGDEIVFEISANTILYGIEAISLEQTGQSRSTFDFLVDFGDRDGDGLPDVWEEEGIDFDGPGIEIDLPGMGADPDKKDIFLELDVMENGLFDSTVLEDSVQRVVDAFARAPASLVDNPDASDGINLHVILGGDTVPQVAMVGEQSDPLSPAYFTAKGLYFGSASQRGHPQWNEILEARLKVFRYGIFAADFKSETPGCTNDELSTSGQVESIPSNDLVVGLGSILTGYSHPAASASEEDIHNGIAGTLMHELGHTLGLTHGGGGANGPQYKPNYLSVMNYAYQMPIPKSLVIGHARAAFVLDYSRSALDTLQEAALDESESFPLPPKPDSEFPRFMIYNAGAEDAANATLVLNRNTDLAAFDWNYNGAIDPGYQSMDLSRFVYSAACTGAEVPAVYEPLTSHSDWERLHYDLSSVTVANDRQPWPASRSAERGMDEHIFAQLLGADWTEHPNNFLIFEDGFETGDVERWVP